MSKAKLLLGALFLMAAMVVGGYLYLNQPHRNIREEAARFMVTSYELEESFKSSGSKAIMVDQVVQVRGKITAMDHKSITLDRTVEVIFHGNLPSSLKEGMKVEVKGRCVGYDDLLEMVKVDQANLLEHF